MRKGAQTRSMILAEAVTLASQVGLEGLSIGSLADRLGLSKSGLFAHFASKETLQLLTLKEAHRLFHEAVFVPAQAAPPGLPRLRALFSKWLAWLERDSPGGCVMLAASVEYDDRLGAVRDLVVAGQRELRGAIAKAIRGAIDAGQLAPEAEPWQLGFEIFGIVLATHHDRRLLGDARSLERARTAFERLIEAQRPSG
jgi:AcrR family transcriptional regulator